MGGMEFVGRSEGRSAQGGETGATGRLSTSLPVFNLLVPGPVRPSCAGSDSIAVSTVNTKFNSSIELAQGRGRNRRSYYQISQLFIEHICRIFFPYTLPLALNITVICYYLPPVADNAAIKSLCHFSTV